MKNKKIIKICVSIAIGLMTSLGALAVDVHGDINLSGTATLNGAGATDATVITFNSAQTEEDGSTFDYAGIADSTPVTMAELDFDAVGYVGDLSIPDLWSFTIGSVTYSFDLTKITYNSNDSGRLNINGYGIAKITDKTDTAGTFVFTQMGGGPTEISFSSSTNVPDSGTTVAFLGLSMLGLAGVARRLRK